MHAFISRSDILNALCIQVNFIRIEKKKINKRKPSSAATTGKMIENGSLYTLKLDFSFYDQGKIHIELKQKMKPK